jgi:arylsulfatase A-like enzyme
MSAYLRENRAHPMFLYTHLDDAHAPYDLGGKGEDNRDAYVKEVEGVGRAIDQLLAVLEEPELTNRSVLIVSADHGEFFGEHGYFFHGRTVYEEVMRVPLLIKSSRWTPRTIDDPVSLLDVGPTILDIFGLAWPSEFMGETLRPRLEGSPALQNRPIPMQSRLDFGLVFPDGYKAMVNWSRHWEEVYDLNADPAERMNLRDRDITIGDNHVGLVKEYFNRYMHTAPNGRRF